MSKYENDLSSIDPRKLLWFSNGVYDLETMQFRGDIRDYVHGLNQHINCGYNYGETRNCNKEAEIMQYWQQVLPERSVREYYLTCLGSCLEGYNREQMVLAIIGCVSSKSTSCQLIQATLGAYCSNIPFDIGCCWSPSDLRPPSPIPSSPMLDSIKNVRVVFAEYSTRESWEKMARLTSDQGICFRPLYQKYPIVVHPQCTPIFLLNTEPDYGYYKKEMPDKIDEVIWGKTINKLPTVSWPIQELIKSIYEMNCCGRVKKFQFKTQFVANPRGDSELHKIANYSERFHDWRLSFFHILLDYYRRYKRNGLPSFHL